MTSERSRLPTTRGKAVFFSDGTINFPCTLVRSTPEHTWAVLEHILVLFFRSFFAKNVAIHWRRHSCVWTLHQTSPLTVLFFAVTNDYKRGENQLLPMMYVTPIYVRLPLTKATVDLNTHSYRQRLIFCTQACGYSVGCCATPGSHWTWCYARRRSCPSVPFPSTATSPSPGQSPTPRCAGPRLWLPRLSPEFGHFRFSLLVLHLWDGK